MEEMAFKPVERYSQTRTIKQENSNIKFFGKFWKMSNERLQGVKKNSENITGLPNLISFAISISFAIWATVLANNMLSDANVQDFDHCQLRNIAIDLRVFGILSFVSLGISVLASIISIPCICVKTCFASKNGEEPNVFESLGSFCVKATSCISSPFTIGLGIALFVFFIIINFLLFDNCGPMQETTQVIAQYFPYVLTFVIFYWVVVGILLLCMPCIILCLCCVCCVSIGSVALAGAVSDGQAGYNPIRGY